MPPAQSTERVASDAASVKTARHVKSSHERAYIFWWRKILGTLQSLEDDYMLGRGSLALTLTVCICAVGTALYLDTVPTVESNGILAGAGPASQRISFSREACGKGLNATSAAQAMLLSAHFLLYNQRPDGTFMEMYNWTMWFTLKPDEDEDAQGMALWALAGFYREVRATHLRLVQVYPKGLQTRLHEAITKTLSFFEENSRKTASGARYIAYPGKSIGQLSLIAQVLLAMVEVKRTLSSGAMPKGVNINAPTFQQTSQGWALERSIREHTDYLLRLRLPTGRFIRTYELKEELSGRPRKQHTAKMHDAYSESLALLALVYVVKYCERGDLTHLAQKSAESLVGAYLNLTRAGGDFKHGALGQEVRVLRPHDAAVRFFRFGGLALAELADIRDMELGLLSAHDRLKDRPSAWAAKALLLGGWEVLEGLAKAKQQQQQSKKGARRSTAASEPEFIEDDSAHKPADWLDDEPQLVLDPQAKRPGGWRDADDGVWEPPQIANPKCVRDEQNEQNELYVKSNRCGKWKRPLIRNPDYAPPKDGDPGGAAGEGVLGRVAGAAAVAARVAWVKSAGKGEDLEDEMGKRFACHAAQALVASGRRQIGGPFADVNSARAARARFSARNADMWGFTFNATKCHMHVRKAVSGSVILRKAKAERALAEEDARRSTTGQILTQTRQFSRANQIHITPGSGGVTIAEMLSKALSGEPTEEEQKKKEEELTDCERAKHAHERCVNDHSVGVHGFQACCRALGGYLFGCLDDHEILPQTQRSLYGPSYEHYCAQDGHVALPADFNSYVPHRFSAFNADKRLAAEDGCDLAALGGVKEESDFALVGVHTAANFLIALTQSSAHLLRVR